MPEEAPISQKFIFTSFSHYIKNNSSFFNTFIDMKRNIESLVIVGNFDDAIAAIDEIDEACGVSIWAVDARMSIYVRVKTPDAMNDFLSNLADKDIEYVASLLHRKHISKSYDIFMSQVFDPYLLEFRKNQRSKIADLLSSFVIPHELDPGRSISNVIEHSSVLNPVDRLIVYRRLINSCINLSATDDNSWVLEFVDFCRSVEGVLDDCTWKNFISTFDHGVQVRVDSEIEYIIELYKRGEYHDVIKYCASYLENNPRDFSIIDIYTRALIFTESESFIKEKQTEIYNSQSMMIVMLSSLHLNADDYYYTTDMIETYLFRLFCFDFVLSCNPLYLSSYPCINIEAFKNACRSLSCSEFLVTPKYFSKIHANQHTLPLTFMPDDLDLITESRRLRYEIEIEINKDNPSIGILNTKLDRLRSQKDVLESEYWNLWSACKIKTGDIFSVIEMVSDLCMDTPSKQILFPFSKLIDEISDNRDFNSSKIESLICHYISTASNNFSEKPITADYFEDFIYSLGVSLPSDLIHVWPEINIKQKYFLETICSTDNLSALIEVETNEDLLFERLKIIKILLNEYGIKSSSLSEEESRIYNLLVVENVAAHHATNKITINSEAIKESDISNYGSYYELISEIREDKIDFISNADSPVSKDVIEKSAYATIYGKVINDFVFNKDFGVVRSLSSEVRHGDLPNHLRSVLEGFNLVTIKESEESYEPNTYWREKYRYTANGPFLNFIDDNLSWFSQECDNLINEASIWPQPTLEKNNKSYAFNFFYDDLVLIEFSDFVKKSESVDEFFSLCEEFIWLKLDDCFVVMKSLLNKNLKVRFNHIFDELNRRLQDNGGSIELQQLGEAISTAKNKMTEEISIIEGWFRRPMQVTFDKVSCNDVINVSLGIIDGIFSPKHVSIKRLGYSSEHILESSQVLGLTRSLVTMMQNALLHGVNKKNIDAYIDVSEDGNEVSISVSNSISEEKCDEIKSKNICSKVSKFSRFDENGGLLVTEGGTGLYKSFRNISDIFVDSDFRVYLDDSLFRQVASIRFGI